MTERVFQITATQKPLLAMTFLLAGVKARLRVQAGCIRAVIEGDFDRQAVANALNNDGFRFAAGQLFTRYSFDGAQVFVRGVTA